MATPATVSTIAATTTATTAIADHLSQARVDLLLRLLKHTHEITSLLGIWKKRSAKELFRWIRETHCQW